MSIYAVGDLQGCLKPLQCLLDKLQFDKKTDQLWCVGDLINRGPESLATLRFIYSLGDSCITVLGNHDLHLLAVACAGAAMKKADTLQEILDAPDADILLDWLRHRPLIHHAHGYTLVHAGIAPQWSISKAIALASEVENVLRSTDYIDFFQQMYGNQPDNWRDDLQGYERLRVITNYFTRMRFCYADGRLDLQNKLGPESAKPDTFPWYDSPDRVTKNDKIIFGHWAALRGQKSVANVYPLDTGCVWGGELTLMRLADEHLFSCDCKS